MGSLTEDPAFLATTFVVVDFETTTPTGHPAQPVEVAALALRYRHGAWDGQRFHIPDSAARVRARNARPIRPRPASQLSRWPGAGSGRGARRA